MRGWTSLPRRKPSSTSSPCSGRTARRAHLLRPRRLHRSIVAAPKNAKPSANTGGRLPANPKMTATPNQTLQRTRLRVAAEAAVETARPASDLVAAGAFSGEPASPRRLSTHRAGAAPLRRHTARADAPSSKVGDPSRRSDGIMADNLRDSAFSNRRRPPSQVGRHHGRQPARQRLPQTPEALSAGQGGIERSEKACRRQPAGWARRRPANMATIAELKAVRPALRYPPTNETCLIYSPRFWRSLPL